MNKTHRNSHRKTFREIWDEAREQCAAAGWARARLASRLRHAAMRRRNWCAGRLLGQIKARTLEHVARVYPEEIRACLDDTYQIGLLSIRWYGHGKLHLPPTAPMALVPLSLSWSAIAMTQAKSVATFSPQPLGTMRA